MEKEKKQEKDELAPKRVFSIKHSEIPKGVTQCVNHYWEKMNDNEIYCPVCQTAAIVGADNIEKYL